VDQRWPLYQADSIVVSDLASNVAVLTLWSDARRIAAALEPGSFAACGNLYSAAGAGYLFRNLLANPRIRYLVLCGADLTGSAQAVLALLGGGGTSAGDADGSRFGLPPSAIQALRRGVRLVNLVGVTDPQRVRAAVESLTPLPPWGEPLESPPPDVAEEAFTSEAAGFVVQHPSAARAWVQLLGLMTRFGRARAGRSPTRELLAVTAVLGGEPAPEESARWFSSDADGEHLEAREIAGRPRLVALDDGHAVALVALFGTLELVRAWPRAAAALRQEHARRAAAAGRPRGALALFVGRLWLHARDRQAVARILERRAPRTLLWRSDPRGLFWIRVEGERIVVEHGTERGRSGRRWEGRGAEELTRAILNEQLVSLPEHAAYLGRELQRAELAAGLGLAYRQDSPLDLSGLCHPPAAG